MSRCLSSPMGSWAARFHLPRAVLGLGVRALRPSCRPHRLLLPRPQYVFWFLGGAALLYLLFPLMGVWPGPIRPRWRHKPSRFCLFSPHAATPGHLQLPASARPSHACKATAHPPHLLIMTNPLSSSQCPPWPPWMPPWPSRQGALRPSPRRRPGHESPLARTPSCGPTLSLPHCSLPSFR